MEAKKHTDGPDELSFLTNGSRLDSGYTGASVVWRDTELRSRKTYMGTNKEVFDEDLYAIGEALENSQPNG